MYCCCILPYVTDSTTQHTIVFFFALPSQQLLALVLVFGSFGVDGGGSVKFIVVVSYPTLLILQTQPLPPLSQCLLHRH